MYFAMFRLGEMCPFNKVDISILFTTRARVRYLSSQKHEVIRDVDDPGADDAERESGEDVRVVPLPGAQQAAVLRAVVGERRPRREDRAVLRAVR